MQGGAFSGVESGLGVLKATALCQLQDLGRAGYQSFGVSRSGAMDPLGLRLANILAGNAQSAACLELALAAASFEVRARTMRLAFVGDFPLSINGDPVPGNASYTLSRGERFDVGASRGGVSGGSHGYLAVAGGFDATPQLGSCATHLRTGLGGFGFAIERGAVLPARLPDAPIAVDRQLPPHLERSSGEDIRAVRGPQDHHFSPADVERFFSESFILQSESDRMGYKLGGNPIRSQADGNIISEPVCPGSIQVPASGDPIVLMADCGSVGGYPKIATVISVDIGRLAQFTPGREIRFREVSVSESQQILADSERRIRAFESGA